MKLTKSAQRPNFLEIVIKEYECNPLDCVQSKILGGGGRGGGTFCTPPPTNNFLWLPTPATPLQASFTATPLPFTIPAPPPPQ